MQMESTETEPTPITKPEQLSPLGRRYFSLIEFDDKEHLLWEIRKHVVGLVLLILSGVFVGLAIVLAAMVILFGVADSLALESGEQANLNSPIIAITFFVVTFVVLATLINAIVYRSSVVYITNQKIAQVLYKTIFHRKISQLSIGDVQDVTVKQVGPISRLFGYGTLVIETAGEQENYTFTYVPFPHFAAKTIIQAHENNMQQYGN